MYVNIMKLELLKFNNCKDCVECCKSKYLAPLVLEDFEKVYKRFPILIAKLDILKPVMLLSHETSCPYLKDEKCSIYQERPPACKIYPFSPWYDSILLDVSCKGVGIEGELLPLSEEEFKNSNFYDSRIQNITQKILNTSEWLKNKKLKYAGKIFGIKLYSIKNINDKYSRFHKKSLLFLRNYKNILTK
ncbi:MAG: YkgJ family cysteine cluster protein [Epsilonproteobacteria bacterium]|nr:YkgJ family cysteine cluster protein [Campylobacterota bacterium]